MDKNWTDVPVGVDFHITNRCNLNCSYCFEKADRNSSHDTTFEETLSVLNQLNSMGVSQVLLEGGEILAAPFIEKLLRKLPDYEMLLHMITNGTLLTPRLADAITESNLSVSVSLDGPTPETNAHRGGKKVFSKILSSIEMLVSKDITTYVNCTVTKKNVHSLGQFMDLCKNMGVDGIILQQLHCSGRSDRKFYSDNFVGIHEINKLREVYMDRKAQYPDILFAESEVFFWLETPERYQEYCKPDLVYYPQRIFSCTAGRKFCVITPSLDVIPCGILEGFTCGNLRERSFRDIWHNSEGLNYIRDMNEVRADVIPTCKSCGYSPICDGGCRGDMYNYSDDWLAPHIFCPYTEVQHDQMELDIHTPHR